MLDELLTSLQTTTFLKADYSVLFYPELGGLDPIVTNQELGPCYPQKTTLN
jgi:hypothetical protein